MSEMLIYLRDEFPATVVTVDGKDHDFDGAVLDSGILSDNASDMDTVEVIVNTDQGEHLLRYQFQEGPDSGEWDLISIQVWST